MISRKMIVILLISLLLFTAMNSFKGEAAGGTGILKAEKAGDWTELFNQTTGWIGADGIYSIPVDGRLLN